MLAFSNWLLRREDEVGCMLYLPIDHLERHGRRLSNPPPAAGILAPGGDRGSPDARDVENRDIRLMAD